MTWRELKAAVEAAGVRDDTEVSYIDMSALDVGRRIGVRVESVYRNVVGITDADEAPGN